MELSKNIPARTKTVEFRWCKKDFMEMSQKYRDIRKGMKPLDSCRWCGHKFKDGEMMALAAPEKQLNWLLCQDCAEALAKEAE